MTLREIISEVRNSLRAVNLDDWIPGKFIYFKLKGFASSFIKRDADSKSFYKFADLWTTIKCLKMVEEDLINCCDIRIPSCRKVMISKDKLPEIYSTRFGYLLNVSSVDYEKDYIYTTPQQFKYTQEREFIDPRKRYYWITNSRIVVPIVSEGQLGPERLTVKGMFPNKAEALKLDQCLDSDDCIKFLDEEFIAPDHLLQDIKNATVIDIIKTNRGVVPDELANLNPLEKVAAK